MSDLGVVDRIAKQEWTEPIADGLQQAISGAFQAGGAVGKRVEEFLHGGWLGHPLHSALTDIPVGAWTAAIVLDATEAMTGNRAMEVGADAAINVGLVGAAASAVTGLTDWHDTDGRARRIGLIHGLLNLSATALFTGSMLLRRADSRGPARAAALAGWLVAAGSAWLGGHLVYEEKIGVDHTAREELPNDFVAVMAAEDIAEGEMRRVDSQGLRILLVRDQGNIYAMAETCAHLGGPLSEGKLEAGTIRCPWHGSRYALTDGAILEGPTVYSQPCFAVRVLNGQIEVRANTPKPSQLAPIKNGS